MKKTLTISIVILSLFSCHSKTENGLIIPLEYGADKVLPFEESGFTYEYEIIPLKIDTSDINSYNQNCHRLIAYKDFIYLLSSTKEPKIYTSTGDYVKSLPFGNGYGELEPYYNDIYINQENDYIEIFQRSKVSKFTLSGDFVEKTNHQVNCSDVCKLGDYLIRYNGMPSIDSSYVSVVNYHTGKPVYTMFTKSPKLGFMTAQGRFMRNRQNVYFNIPFTRELFKITKGDSIPSVLMTIDNLLKYEECSDLSFFKAGEYSDAKKQNCNIDYLSVSADESIISFRVCQRSLADRNSLYRVIYDKNNNRIIHYPITSMDIIFSDGEYDYAIAQPERIEKQKETFSESERPLMDELSELVDKNGFDTNPYIVKLKIAKQ